MNFFNQINLSHIQRGHHASFKIWLARLFGGFSVPSLETVEDDTAGKPLYSIRISIYDRHTTDEFADDNNGTNRLSDPEAPYPWPGLSGS